MSTHEIVSRSRQGCFTKPKAPIRLGPHKYCNDPARCGAAAIVLVGALDLGGLDMLANRQAPQSTGGLPCVHTHLEVKVSLSSGVANLTAAMPLRRCANLAPRAWPDPQGHSC